MPELPELEVFAVHLNKLFKGKKLLSLKIHRDKKITNGAELRKMSEKKILKGIYREGKQLYFDFGKHILAIHLMLKGKFALKDGLKVKNPIAEFDFGKLGGFYLIDQLGQARIHADPEESTAPDAMSEDVNIRNMKKWLKEAKSPDIKTFLMDQDIIRGIGNAYADEILYNAGISPFSNPASLPATAVKKLVKSIPLILTAAQRQLEKQNPGSLAEGKRDFLEVHVPKKKATFSGEKIIKGDINGRSTYYTKSQELYK